MINLKEFFAIMELIKEGERVLKSFGLREIDIFKVQSSQHVKARGKTVLGLTIDVILNLRNE